MSVAKLITEATERGEFGDLNGTGARVLLRSAGGSAGGVLKSSRFVPEEVERTREVGQIREAARNRTDNTARARLSKCLCECELARALILERNKRRK